MCAILLNIIDTGYFSFQNGRSDADYVSNMLFSIDTANLLPQYLRDYWYHSLVFIGIYAILELWFPRYKSYNISFGETMAKYWKIAFCSLFAIFYTAFCFALFRGFGAKTPSVVDAMRYTKAKYAPLTLNTPFTVVRTIGKSSLQSFDFYSQECIDSASHVRKQYKFTEHDFTKKNVIIFILEGFSQRSVGALSPDKKGYTPFLDSIIEHSCTFTNAFANGSKSIQSVPAILSSVPQLMDNTIIGSKYTANLVDALPIVLGTEGYKTAFFHGAFNGSMNFDKYCEAIGFDSYYGMNEFLEHSQEAGNYDSDWGIFDDKFLQFAIKEMNNFSQPFFSTIFTISSHHPYVVPDEFKHLFNESRPELNALRYADFSLQQFFKIAQQCSWFSNTLFVFVADHTVPYSFESDVTNSYISPIDRYRIPIVFYDPSQSNASKRDNRVVQQIDILPSILYQLKYSKPFLSFGENMFDSTSNAQAMYYHSGIYTYIDSNSVIEFNGKNVSSCYKVERDTVVPANPTENQLFRMKSFIQEYSYRMIFNQTSIENNNK